VFGRSELAVFAAALGGFWLVLTVLAVFNRPRSGPDTLVLHHAWWLRFVGLLVGPLMSMFFAVMAAVEPPEPKYVPMVAGFLGGFALLGGAAYWETIRFALALTPDGLDYVSPWTGRRRMPWESLRELSYNRVPGTFVVRSDAGTARAGLAVPKVAKLVEAVEQRLPVEKLKGAIDGYSAIGRYFPYPPKKR
jgi:hypothetical protein